MSAMLDNDSHGGMDRQLLYSRASIDSSGATTRAVVLGHLILTIPIVLIIDARYAGVGRTKSFLESIRQFGSNPRRQRVTEDRIKAQPWWLAWWFDGPLHQQRGHRCSQVHDRERRDGFRVEVPPRSHRRGRHTGIWGDAC